MKKCLIISYSYPPLNVVSSRRFNSIAKHMKNYGWDPYILTTYSSGTLTQYIEEGHVFRVGEHTHKSGKVGEFTLKGIRGAFISVVAQVYRRFNNWFRTMDKSLIVWLPIVWKERLRLNRWIETQEFDIVVASYGPVASIVLANYIFLKHDIPWVWDVRDLIALKIGERVKILETFDCFVEKMLTRSCSGITAIGETLSSILEERYNKPTKTIYNGRDFNDVVSSNRGESTELGEKYLLYAGVFYSHTVDALEVILHTLSEYTELFDLNIRIRSLGPPAMEERILSMASNYNLVDRVVIAKPCSLEELFEEENCAFANIVLEDLDSSCDWKRGTLTGKLMHLINQRPPVIAVARADSEISTILNRTEKGLLCSNSDEVRQLLEKIITSPRVFQGNANTIREFSGEAQAAKLCEFIDCILSYKSLT